MIMDYFYHTHKICLLGFAEKEAIDPVMKVMWRLKKENLRQKRTKYVEEKSRQLRKTKERKP